MNMKANFDPRSRVEFDSFLLNIFSKFKFENNEPCDLSDDLLCGIVKLKVKVNRRNYKHCWK